MSNNVRLAILVSALGYFVDVYDLILFSILRTSSLTDLGLSGDELVTTGGYLLNMQMFGFLIGGVLWGVIGDKIGRIELLFGSILLYSVGNILNGFVGQFGPGVDSLISPIDQYAWLRLITGIGLAGEIGGGITLVSELLPKKSRGYGTTIVVATGVAGAVVAGGVYEFFSWRMAYIVGGVMGLGLLLLRLSVAESGIFKAMTEKEHVARGNFFMLFTSWDRFTRYIFCILVGLPIWYSLGIVVTFSPEIAAALGITEKVIAGSSVFWFYCGITSGSVANGLFSQWVQSRKLAIGVFLFMTLASLAAIFHVPLSSATEFYTLVFILGFFTAYWAMLVTISAEQFGTNLRATVATSVPNFVRGATVPAVILFTALKPDTGIVGAAEVVGILVAAFALLAFFSLRETFHVDLDYVETDAKARAADRLTAMGQQLPRSPVPDWRRYVLWMLIWVAFIASLGYAASYGELGFLENSVSVTAEPNREGVPLQSDPVIQVKVTVRNNTRDTVTLKAPSACKMFRWQVFSRDGNMVQSKVTDEDTCPKTEVSAILPSGEKLEEFYSIALVPTRYQAGNDYLVQYWYWGYEGEFQFKAE